MKELKKYLMNVHGVELDKMDTGGGFQSYFHELNTNQDHILMADSETGGLPTDESKELVIDVRDEGGECLWTGTYENDEYVNQIFDAIFLLWGY